MKVFAIRVYGAQGAAAVRALEGIRAAARKTDSGGGE
jgi:hypothetical protein